MHEPDYRDALYASYVTSGQAADFQAAMRHAAPYLRKLVRAHFPGDKSARIIDLGCGPGVLVAVARASGYTNVSGVDVSAEQVAVAKANGIGGVTQDDLANTLDRLDAGSVDTLVAFDVLEHFRKEEIVRLLKRAHAALRSGGRLIVHVPNGESPMFGAVMLGDFTHETGFTRKSMAQVLKACGFGAVHCYEDVPVAHGVKSTVRRLLWRSLVRPALRFWLAVETGDTGRETLFTQNFLTVTYRD